MLKITVTRHEGPHHSVEKPVAVATFAEANTILSAWSIDAPKHGYDKCSILIEKEGLGGTRFRYDLRRFTEGQAIDVKSAIVGEMNFWMTGKGSSLADEMAKAHYAKWLPSVEESK